MENNYYDQNYYYNGYAGQQQYQYQHQIQPQNAVQQPKQDFSWCRRRQFHNNMKLLQQQEPTSVSRMAKSTTGNLLGLVNNPLGVADNPNYSSRAAADNIIGAESNWNFHHYNNDTIPTNEQNHKSDEELTSMLQRYLGDQQMDFSSYHQKSPGQQSSDSGFSGDQQQNGKFNQNNMGFDLSDYDDNCGEDLSQLVDQVLNSMDAQFPEDPYLQYVDQSNISETPKKPKEEQERKAVAVARPIQQNCARNCPATAQSTPLLTQQNFAEQPKTILPCKPFENCKKRTVGVVEPRVVVKIPLAKVRENKTEADFLPAPSLEAPDTEESRKRRNPNEDVETSNEENETQLPSNDEKRLKIEAEKPVNPLKLVRKLQDNQISYSVQSKQNLMIPESKMEESKQIQEEPKSDKEPFEKYNYMDNLPTFTNLNEVKSEKVTKLRVEKETDGKWMYCKVKNCHFWTRKQVRMERHERSHVPGDDKFYQCPECQLKICSLSKLLRHDRKFHTGFKDYECKICEAEVTDIAVHMRVHRTEKQFTCHVCKLQFRHKNSLVRHLFQHSGERPFRCQNCESGFTSINRLKEHIKKKHPDTPAAQSIMEQPQTLNITTPPTVQNVQQVQSQQKLKFTPIAPAPAKIPTYQPQTIMLNQPFFNQNTMFLVSNPQPTLMFPQQMFLPTLTYGILQPQVQTIIATAPSSDEITILPTPEQPKKIDILERAILEISNEQEK